MTAASDESHTPAPAIGAGDIRRYLERAYDLGLAEGEDGSSVPIEPHGLSRLEAEGIRDLAVSESVRSTLEVGLGLGLGTLSLCEALLEVGQPGAHHLVVEPFPDDFAAAGRQAIRAAGIQDLVELLVGESQLILPRLVTEGREFDLALIDGDHRFEGVFLDLCFADRLVRPHGLVIVDDLWMPAIRMAVSYMERNLGWTLLPAAMARAFRWRRPRSLRAAGCVAPATSRCCGGRPHGPTGRTGTCLRRRDLHEPVHSGDLQETLQKP